MSKVERVVGGATKGGRVFSIIKTSRVAKSAELFWLSSVVEVNVLFVLGVCLSGQV